MAKRDNPADLEAVLKIFRAASIKVTKGQVRAAVVAYRAERAKAMRVKQDQQAAPQG